MIRSPVRAAFSISRSCTITSSVAMPAAIARSFLAKVEPCTTARSMRLNIFSKIGRRISTAPHGTWPPESAFASSTMSGSTLQCSTARKRPVRPRPGLDFVGHEQRAVAAADLGGGRKVAVRRHVDALALDRLDEESRDLARRDRALQRREVVERHARRVRQQRLEAVAEDRVAVERQRAVGQAVERMIAEYDARPAGRGARELDRGLDRLRAGIGEEHLVEIGHLREQPLGQISRPASTRRVARDWAGRCRAPRSTRPAAPGGCGRCRTRRTRSADRDSGRRRGRRDTGPCRAGTARRSRWSAAPAPSAR